jgi:hypothetical protein
MRSLRYAALAAPLVFAIACKKQTAPEPAPPAAPPMVEWSFGPATFSGSRAEGNTGTLTVPVTIQNNTEGGLVMQSLRLEVMGADGKGACAKKVDMTDKTGGNSSLKASIELDCPFTAFPEEGRLMGKGTALYKLGGDDKQENFDAKIKFQR